MRGYVFKQGCLLQTSSACAAAVQTNRQEWLTRVGKIWQNGRHWGMGVEHAMIKHTLKCWRRRWRSRIGTVSEEAYMEGRPEG